jgi:WD40 repeat protein/serine/threonine protein kinase
MSQNLATDRSIFLDAIEIASPLEREAFIARICGADLPLLSAVKALVAAHDQAGDLLDAPDQLSPTMDRPLAERPGAAIGPYKLMEEIGAGGFGLVFVAEQQQPLRRKVALKVIKPWMDTREVIARFEAERQALALMDHPNIARVFDGGATPSGRPYFVMELVRGMPITEFCDQNLLPVRERLELFVCVCQAIQHAHQKGVIHRDLKPSNIMVSMHDATPVVKVIDFGIAKAVGHQLTDKTVYTRFIQMIGTPVYMSPEQAGMSGLDIDTRTDIYALGVLLYELLTGTTPFDKERLRTAENEEIRRIIREEDPPKPSTRFTTLDQGVSTVSSNRKSDPKHLAQLCRGELDWIVMKALEKDRNRRYESASSFAADVQRYLADEPVQACPPSAWYRFRKFARRNKGVLATAGTIAAALLLAVASLVGAVSVLAASNAEIKQEQKQTEKALDREKNAKDELLGVLKREQRTLYLKRIALAERELAANNVGRAEEMLDECPLNLRGWEWHYLRRGRGPVTLEGYGSWVFGVAFSPDGKYIASADKSGEVKVWQRATGEVVHRLLGHAALAFAVAFRPDGKQLASAGWDSTVRIWDLETGKQVSSLTDHREYVTSVAYSPDGKLLASAGGNAIIIWDAVTLQKQHTLPGRTRTGYHLAFSPDSRRLASAAYGEAITLWDATSGQEIYAIRGGLFQRVVFSRDGRTLVSAEFDGTVRFWDADTGQHRSTIHADPAIVGIALSPDGQRLATGGFERPVHIWDLETRQEALVLRGHTEMVHELAFSSDGQQLASASWDGTVKIWDASAAPIRSDAETLTLRGFPVGVMGVAFHPDNQRLATASFETVQLWNTTTGAELTALPGHTGIVAGVVFSRDGRTLAAAAHGGLIKTWAVETAKEGRTFRGSAGTVALSPDGQRVAAVLKSGEIHIWNTVTGKEELSPFQGHPAPVQSIVFSPDGQKLATAASDMTAALWDATTGRRIHELSGHSHAVMHAAFSADGKRLATASLDKTAKIWDSATGAELLTLQGHDDRVIGVAFSPDGKLLATASWDNTAKVWDALTGIEIDTLRGHSGYVFSVAFSPDGKLLASAGGYRSRGEVKIWNTAHWENKVDQK